ncbi:Tubulin-tyrosine ligase family protein [Histomonas meleagridis]|uniref:Tubulin-tyrosine ligase family protein n=1 Tax=Histomonas meleagridis TaxID=135588 RepID=UPI0035598DB0|nr:Tubulin-tyrosine ligase family protein [Histomonas meleagridis]KAH0798665.1 Tubulin-tyrosine ligase family protein [Histomonas meleagridis]
MEKLQATNGKVLFAVVKQALRLSGIEYTKANPNAMLVWTDTMKVDYFQQMMPWQVINRIPWARTMCRKAPYVRLICRTAKYFPNLYDFIPKSFILPLERNEFHKAYKESPKKYIYKPDKGALGHGIKVINSEKETPKSRHLAVIQEYIDSFTIDNKKFDLRIYVLILSVKPLTIYVYRGGVARFCSETVDTNSKFSLLTNTAVNIKNPDAIPDKMTQMLSDVFEKLKQMGYDIDALWERIDRAIVLSVISAYGFLSKFEDEECPNLGYSRCFQIVGFDVLLDKQLKPYVLEINFRPSLKCNTMNSHTLKQNMLMDALKIAAPLMPLQRLKETTEFPTDAKEFKKFMENHKDTIQQINELRAKNEIGNGFKKCGISSVFPQIYYRSKPQNALRADVGYKLMFISL